VGQKVALAFRDFCVKAAVRGTLITYGSDRSTSGGRDGESGMMESVVRRSVVVSPSLRIRLRCDRAEESRPECLSHL
jgi:hypothetical protein